MMSEARDITPLDVCRELTRLGLAAYRIIEIDFVPLECISMPFQIGEWFGINLRIPNEPTTMFTYRIPDYVVMRAIRKLRGENVRHDA